MKRPGCWDAGNQDQGNDSRPDTVEYFHHPDIVLKMIEKQSDGQYDTKSDMDTRQVNGGVITYENGEAKEKALASIGEMLSASSKEEHGKKMMNELPSSISIKSALRKKF